MGAQIPGAAPSGNLHVVLLAVGLAKALPTDAVVAMLFAKVPSPADALHCFINGCAGVLTVHVLRPLCGRVAAVRFRCAKLQSPPLLQQCFAWNLHGILAVGYHPGTGRTTERTFPGTGMVVMMVTLGLLSTVEVTTIMLQLSSSASCLLPCVSLQLSS